MERVAARVVRVIGREQLVAGREVERSHDRVHAGRRVGNEREPLRIRAQELRDVAPRLVEQALELGQHEAHGLALDALSNPLRGLEHGNGAGTERPVVQEVTAGSRSQFFRTPSAIP